VAKKAKGKKAPLQEKESEFDLKDRTDEELKQLAVDIIEGKFFSTIGMPESDFDLLAMIFMPLALMDEETVNRIEERDPVIFYADMSKRLSRSISGYPIFGEVGFIFRSELEKFATFYDQYLDIKNAFLDKNKKNSTPS